jgi:hypothetical protein
MQILAVRDKIFIGTDRNYEAKNARLKMPVNIPKSRNLISQKNPINLLFNIRKILFKYA